MSAKNGDKARYHRERKKRILRNKNTRELKKQLAAGNKDAQPATA